jgi:hypothetical protein
VLAWLIDQIKTKDLLLERWQSSFLGHTTPEAFLEDLREENADCYPDAFRYFGRVGSVDFQFINSLIADDLEQAPAESLNIKHDRVRALIAVK